VAFMIKFKKYITAGQATDDSKHGACALDAG
jgi:hypothetical protein